MPSSDLNSNQCVVDNPRSACAISCALELIGDRWTLLIVRDLMLTNKCEFGHLLRSLEGISTNILSNRLERLQHCGLLEKHPHPSHGKKFVYALTQHGLDLAPVLVELALWSEGAVEGAMLPTELRNMLKKDKTAVIDAIRSGGTLFTLDL